jgi:cysteine-rich repeat protein
VPALRRWLALVLVTAAVAGARQVSALTACTATEIVSQDPGCPVTGACSVTKVFDVGNGCVLDFGSRDVTITTSGELDIAQNVVTVKAHDFTIAAGGFIDGRGTSAPPRDRGGTISIVATGAVALEKATAGGKIDVTGDTIAGTILIDAGGTVTIGGILRAVNGAADAPGGLISIAAGGDILVPSGATVVADGGSHAWAGSIDLVAEGRIDTANISLGLTGGDGGDLSIDAGADAVVTKVEGNANGDAGTGGSVTVDAGTGVRLTGAILARGTTATDGSAGGTGGQVDVSARAGDLVVEENIVADGASPDGIGGAVSLTAEGSVAIQPAATVSAMGGGGDGSGGEIDVTATFDVSVDGRLDATATASGGSVDVLAGRAFSMTKSIKVNAGVAGAGGSVFIDAGSLASGDVSIDAAVDVGAGGCDTLGICGSGGSIDVTGCNVVVTADGLLDGRAPFGGDIDLTVRELLTVVGSVDAQSTSGQGDPGTTEIQHPIVLTPVGLARVLPAPATSALPRCTAAGQQGCLVPCPACGNGAVEFPETCDDGLPPASCDGGCSTFCRTEACDDGSPCTVDSCDPLLGCHHLPLANGTSCSDGVACNGDETCVNGACTAGMPVECDDARPCTTDACVEPGGCAHVPVSTGTPCEEGDLCTIDDQCDAAGDCIPGVPRSCDDGKECTTDACNPSVGCVHLNDSGPCTDDGNDCTGDVCNAGLCVHPTLANGTPCTSDGVECTTDACGGGVCLHGQSPDGTACEDGAFCTANDRCVGGSCRGGQPRDCQDGFVCTTDACVEGMGCTHAPVPAGTPCLDLDVCTVGETCDGAGTCVAGGVVPCDDGNGCTDDGCDPIFGCTAAPRPNGTPCTAPGSCSTGDACQAGLCVAGPPTGCDDGDPCTTDTCTAAGCQYDPVTPCCGNGIPEAGEPCDDGNTSDTDACVAGCVAATCGDGFVQAGVEQCDLGAANSESPDALCRTDCRPARCGDGVVDPLAGEQCDDGNTTAGDGCGAGCLEEPPPTAGLIAGRGSRLTECLYEVAIDRPVLNKKGLPLPKQSCQDGDPSCDRGSEAGVCLFRIWPCVNLHDPQTPFCVPGAAAVGPPAVIEVRRPTERDATRRPEDAQNRAALLAALAPLAVPTPDLCGAPIDIRVPLKSPTRKGSKPIKVRVKTVLGRIDSDSVKLECLP